MPDRRESLLEAAIAAVREGGYAALTQPKVGPGEAACPKVT